jgi:hypothetical protein
MADHFASPKLEQIHDDLLRAVRTHQGARRRRRSALIISLAAFLAIVSAAGAYTFLRPDPRISAQYTIRAGPVSQPTVAAWAYSCSGSDDQHLSCQPIKSYACRANRYRAILQPTRLYDCSGDLSSTPSRHVYSFASFASAPNILDATTATALVRRHMLAAGYVETGNGTHLTRRQLLAAINRVPASFWPRLLRLLHRGGGSFNSPDQNGTQLVPPTGFNRLATCNATHARASCTGLPTGGSVPNGASIFALQSSPKSGWTLARAAPEDPKTIRRKMIEETLGRSLTTDERNTLRGLLSTLQPTH